MYPLQIDAPTAGPAFASVFYKRANQLYGSDHDKCNDVNPNHRRHPLTNQFTRAHGQAGMWTNHGLKTAISRDRFADGQNDWMLKNL